ncbi:MAG: gamma-glutamyltransferase [Kofleriaceae bacterium]|nr:gamma-glutamyltransferase [Kofleriaceae bacterium]
MMLRLCLIVVLVGCSGGRSDSVKREAPNSASQVSGPEQEDSEKIATGPDDGAAIAPAPGEVQVAVGRLGAVSSAEGHASDIGLAVLRRGGNAVDAAVAVGFALGVTQPSAGNIGGGGFMIIRLPDGKSAALDYREVAPGQATSDMYLDAAGVLGDESRFGPRAAGIPGVVAGFWAAHQKYGSLPWKSLVEPAVLLAREGWELDRFHAEDLEWVVPVIEGFRERSGKSKALSDALDATLQNFRKDAKTLYREGDLWQQVGLGKTLAAIAEGGQDAFYKGALAKEMAQKVTAMGGLWSADDLAKYKAVWRKTIEFEYRGHTIITMPPPSAGGIGLRQVLAAADTLNLEKLDWDSVERIHLYVEALRRIYADRNNLLGDPDYVKIPMDELLDVKYMAKRMADVNPKRATPSSEIRTGKAVRESEQTTHFSIVDKNGMAVANTFTLNGGFGAKVQIPGTGITLNNEMDDFTAKVGAANMYGLVQGPQNAIEPGKRMLSSMTPTIISKDGKIRAVLGSPGGPTITTTVVQILMQILDHGRSLAEAIAAPRVHHQWLPDKIWHEHALDKTLSDGLRSLGHQLTSRGSIGHANCIERRPNGEYHAVADSIRDGGKAVAY